MSDEITIYSQPGALMRRNPRHVLAEAHEAAVALQEIVNARPKKLVLGGETYLQIEDWTTVAHFYGFIPSLVEDRYVEYGGAQGWEATAAVRRIVDGLEISRATAMCLNDEENWSNRPAYEWHYVTKTMGVVRDDPGREEIVWEPGQNGKNRPKKVKVKVGDEPVPMHQLRSMAQTRANAKALANVLRFVPVLAGYKGVPAEEMSGRWGEPDTADEYPQQAEGSPSAQTEPKQRRQRAAKPAQEPASKGADAGAQQTQAAAEPTDPLSVKPQRTREEYHEILKAARVAGLDDKTVEHHMGLVYSGRRFSQLRDEEAASLLAWAKGPSHSVGTTTRPEPAGVKVNPPATVGEVLARHGIAQEPAAPAAVSPDTLRKLGTLGKWPGTTLTDVRRACMTSFGMELEVTLERIPGAYSALVEWAAESDPQVNRDAVLMQVAENIGNAA